LAEKLFASHVVSYPLYGVIITSLSLQTISHCRSSKLLSCRSYCTTIHLMDYLPNIENWVTFLWQQTTSAQNGSVCMPLQYLSSWATTTDWLLGLKMRNVVLNDFPKGGVMRYRNGSQTKV